MRKKPRWVDGDVISYDNGLLVRGHIGTEEFNEIVADFSEDEPLATAVLHTYVRFIPGPWEGYDGRFEHWGTNPTDKRGCIKVTERCVALDNGKGEK